MTATNEGTNAGDLSFPGTTPGLLTGCLHVPGLEMGNIQVLRLLSFPTRYKASIKSDQRQEADFHQERK